MARNSAKLHWTLDDLGWHLHPPGRMDDWDGLIAWFVTFTAKRPDTLVTSSLRDWRRAAVAVLGR